MLQGKDLDGCVLMEQWIKDGSGGWSRLDGSLDRDESGEAEDVPLERKGSIGCLRGGVKRDECYGLVLRGCN